MDIMFRVSLADGAQSESEARLVSAAKEIFNFSDSQYNAVRSRYIKDVDRFYAILSSKRTDSNEEIKASYRQLVKEYHPDKIISKGLPEEFTKLAEEKFREIQEAYEAIRKERNIR